jgi:tRNA 2-thiouridine synthesizing protein A
MMIEIDVRGLACPIPVIRTKKVLDEMEEGTVLTIVDNAASKENVLRLARAYGCEVEVEPSGGDFRITITKRKEE